MNIKSFLSCFAAILAAINISGAPITPDEAIAAAASFNSDDTAPAKAPSPSAGYTITYTSQSPQGTGFYVVSSPRPDGFTIVSADDRLPQILGYSKEGHFPAGAIPCNMKAWLDAWQRQIDSFLTQAEAADQQPRLYARTYNFEAIAPMVTSRWNQSEPFNNLCPVDPKTNARSVTGCVATAMAQVMNFHKWPPTAHGTTGDGFPFEGTKYDWDNMADIYQDGKYSQQQANAVATLMLHCGKSVGMHYTSTASGAPGEQMGVALLSYFDYDASIRLYNHAFYNQNEWENIVYRGLADGSPVFICGSNDKAGHAFVCDGYEGNGYFHFNWGWGGLGDGYFRLFALNPMGGGIGSSSGGYNLNQMCITGIKPRGDGESQPQTGLVMTDSPEIRLTPEGAWNITFRDGALYNYTCAPQSLTAWIYLKSLTNEADTICLDSLVIENLKPIYGFRNLTMEPVNGIADGDYKFFMATHAASGELEEVPAPAGKPNYVVCSFKNGRVSFTTPPAEKTEAKVIFNGITSPDGRFYANGPSPVSIVFSNVGNDVFTGTVLLDIIDETGRYHYDLDPDYINEFPLTIAPGYSETLEFGSLRLTSPGKYHLEFALFNGGPSTRSETDIVVEESPDPAIDSGTCAEAVSILPYMSTPTDVLRFSAGFARNPDSEVSSQTGPLIIRLIPENGNDTVRWSTPKPVTLRRMDSKIEYSLRVDTLLKPGKYRWQLAQMINDREVILSRSCPFYFYRDNNIEAGESRLGYIPFDNESVIVENRFSSIGQNVIVPDSAGGKEVCRLWPDAFTFADGIRELTLPSGLRSIGPGQFYSAAGLETLTLLSSEPPVLSPEAFGDLQPEEVKITVPDGKANVYKRSPEWERFGFGQWQLYIDGSITSLSGLAGDGETPYNPYYVSYDESPVIQAVTSDGSRLRADIVIDGEVSTLTGDGSIQLPALHGRTARLYLCSEKGYNAIDSAEADIDGTFDIYTISGTLVMRGAGRDDIARLSPGLYLIGTRSLLVR